MARILAGSQRGGGAARTSPAGRTAWSPGVLARTWAAAHAAAQGVAEGLEDAELTREVEGDDVAVPGGAHGVEHVGQPAEDAAGAADGGGLAGRGGVVDDPADAGDFDFGPGVGVGLSDDEVFPDVVPVSAEEAVDVAGAQARGACEEDHGGGEVLAVALLPAVEEVLQGSFACGGARRAGVAEVGVEPVADGVGAGARIVQAVGQAPGDLLDALGVGRGGVVNATTCPWGRLGCPDLAARPVGFGIS